MITQCLITTKHDKNKKMNIETLRQIVKQHICHVKYHFQIHHKVLRSEMVHWFNYVGEAPPLKKGLTITISLEEDLRAL